MTMDEGPFITNTLAPHTWGWSGTWVERRCWEDCPVQQEPFAKDFYPRLLTQAPVFASVNRFFVWSEQPDTTWILFDHKPHAFGVQIDPSCEVLVVFDHTFNAEYGTWHADPVAVALEVISARYQEDQHST